MLFQAVGIHTAIRSLTRRRGRLLREILPETLDGTAQPKQQVVYYAKSYVEPWSTKLGREVCTVSNALCGWKGADNFLHVLVDEVFSFSSLPFFLG